MAISNEIRIHDATGNATSIGGTAIRLKLHPKFQAPCTAGFHIYDASSQQLQNVLSYQLALKAARDPNTVLVWREDLTPNQLATSNLTTNEAINQIYPYAKTKAD
jgi:hypothetical protein